MTGVFTRPCMAARARRETHTVAAAERRLSSVIVDYQPPVECGDFRECFVCSKRHGCGCVALRCVALLVRGAASHKRKHFPAGGANGIKPVTQATQRLRQVVSSALYQRGSTCARATRSDVSLICLPSSLSRFPLFFFCFFSSFLVSIACSFTSQQCDACSQQDSCKRCTHLHACGWCGSSNRCYSGGEAPPAYAECSTEDWAWVSCGACALPSLAHGACCNSCWLACYGALATGVPSMVLTDSGRARVCMCARVECRGRSR